MAYRGPTFIPEKAYIDLQKRRFDSLVADTPMPSEPLRVDTETAAFHKMVGDTVMPSEQFRRDQEAAKFQDMVGNTEMPSQQFAAKVADSTPPAADGSAAPEASPADGPPTSAGAPTDIPAAKVSGYGVVGPDAATPADDPVQKTIDFLKTMGAGQPDQSLDLGKVNTESTPDQQPAEQSLTDQTATPDVPRMPLTGPMASPQLAKPVMPDKDFEDKYKRGELTIGDLVAQITRTAGKQMESIPTSFENMPGIHLGTSEEDVGKAAAKGYGEGRGAGAGSAGGVASFAAGAGATGDGVGGTLADMTRGPTATGRRWLASAEREFGVTDNPRDAGYLTPDGKFLDFSEGGGMGRTADHRQIGQATGKGGTDGMLDFMGQTGSVRWNVGSDGYLSVDFSRPLTKEQRDVIRAHAFNGGAIDVNHPTSRETLLSLKADDAGEFDRALAQAEDLASRTQFRTARASSKAVERAGQGVTEDSPFLSGLPLEKLPDGIAETVARPGGGFFTRLPDVTGKLYIGSGNSVAESEAEALASLNRIRASRVGGFAEGASIAAAAAAAGAAGGGGGGDNGQPPDQSATNDAATASDGARIDPSQRRLGPETGPVQLPGVENPPALSLGDVASRAGDALAPAVKGATDIARVELGGGPAAGPVADAIRAEAASASEERFKVDEANTRIREALQNGQEPDPADEELASQAALEMAMSMGPGGIEKVGAKVAGVAGRLIGRAGDKVGTATGEALAKVAATSPEMSAWQKIRAGRELKPEAEAVPLQTRLETMRRTLVRAITDNAVDLSEFRKKAAATYGADLPPEMMVDYLARANPDMASKVKVDENVKPLIQQMGDLEPWVADLLTARNNADQAATLGARVGKDLTEARQFSGGAQAADSAPAVKYIEQQLGPEAFARVKGFADDIVGQFRNLLEEKVDAGLVSRRAADQWLTDYPNYVKTEITDHLKETSGGGTGGGSLSVQSNGIKRLTVEGTTKTREDPIASLVYDYHQTEALVKKNRAFNAFVNLRDVIPGGDQLFREVPNGYSGTNVEKTVTGFVDGERKTYVTSSEEMAKVLRREGLQPIPGVVPAMQLFKDLITSRNPSFLVGNAMIDAPVALIRESIRAGGPQEMPHVAAEIVKGYLDAFKGLASDEFRGASTAAFLKEGGGLGRSYDRSEQSGAQTLADLRKRNAFDISSPMDLARAIKGIVLQDATKAIGERVELGPRVAAFNLARGRGESDLAAMINGRTVTTDFAQGGWLAKTLNQIIPFLNPAVQGGAALPRMIAENPKAAAMVYGAGLVAPTMAIELWNRSDPQRARDYEDVPQYLKDRGLVVMLPVAAPLNQDGERRPQLLAINLRELSLVTALTREAMSAAVGDNWRGWANLAEGVAPNVSPLSGISSALPPGPGTAVQLWANKDAYRGSTIATAANDERASAISKAIANVVGSGVRPSQVEFTGQNLGGFAAQAASAGSDLVAADTKRSGTPQDIPVAGGFIRRLIRGDTGERLAKARENALSPETRQALQEYGVKYEVAPVRGQIGGANGVKLLPREIEDYQTRANQYVDSTIQRVVGSGRWDRMNNVEREKELKTIVSNAHEKAGAEVLRTIPASVQRSRKAG